MLSCLAVFSFKSVPEMQSLYDLSAYAYLEQYSLSLCMFFVHLPGPGLCNCGIISIVLPISHSVCVLLSSCVSERAVSE